MKQILNKLFQGLKPTEIVDLFLLALAAIMLPYTWNMSFWCVILLLVNAVVKAFKAGRVGNSILTPLQKCFLLSCVAYVLVCAVSLFYTSNMEKGVSDALGKCTLLFSTVAFLISDYSYVKKIHLRAILYLFSVALIIRFIIRFIYLLVAVHNGAALSSCIDFAFDPATHHSYVSMYVLLAMVFLTMEMMAMPKKYIVFYALALLLMVTHLFCMQSRAGLLCLAIIAFIGLLMYVFIHKKYFFGLLAFAGAVLLIIGITKFIPDFQTRMVSTAEAVMQGQRTDDRFAIADGSLYVIKENFPWGTGIGDRMDELLLAYQVVGAQKPYDYQYNPHNQYLDAMMTEGLLGLLSFVAMLLMPVIYAIKKQNWLLLFFMIIVIENACFESILERQMGEIFFSLFVVLFLSPVLNIKKEDQQTILDAPSHS